MSHDPMPRRAVFDRTLGAALILIGGLLAAACGGESRGSGMGADLSDGHRRLVAALGGERPIEARLVGFDRWRPCPAPRCVAPAGLATGNSRALRGAARAIRSAAVDDSATSAAVHARAVWSLAWSTDWGAVESAVARLERAASGDDAGPRILADLAAAHLLAAAGGNSFAHLTAALDAAERALDGDRRLPTALFNRALALEKLGLPVATGGAWGAYLDAEPDPAWRAEALARREALPAEPAEERFAHALTAFEGTTERELAGAATALVAAHAQPAREHLERQLLPAWMEVLAGAGTADRSVEAQTRSLAAALLQTTGDRLAHDEVDRVDRLLAAGDHPAIDAHAAGHRDLCAARALYETQEYAAARERFETAARSLGRADSPFALEAELYAGVCRRSAGDPVGARPAFDRALALARPRGYRVIEATSLWMLGLTDAAAGRLTTALARYRAAREIFEEARHDQNTAAVDYLLAESHRLLGERSRSARHLHAALGRAGSIHAPRWRHSIYRRAALEAEVRPRAALPFAEASLASARRHGAPAVVAEALLTRAAIGDPAEGERFVHEAAERIGDLAGTDVGEVLSAHLAMETARRLRPSDPQAAIAELGRALDAFAADGLESLLVDLRLERGRMHRVAGDADAAAADLETGLSIVERHRRRLDRLPSRVAFAERGQRLVDELLSLEHDRRPDDPELLLLAARSHGRELLAQRVGGDVEDSALTVDDVARIANGPHSTLQYKVLSDRTLLWAMGGGAVEPHTIAAGRDELAGRVGEFVAAIAAWEEPAAIAPLAEELYDLLIAPAADAIESAEVVVVLADGPLHHLPFAALRDPDDGRYLAEQLVSVRAPGLAHLARPAAPCRSEAAQRLVAIGDPAFDAALFPELPPLPRAAEEAASVGRLYPESAILLGPEATRERLTEALAGAEVLHFAGHALADAADPFRARLVLAPGDAAGDTGELSAPEIAGLDLAGLRLVNLSACSTAGTAASRSEGLLGLARPFLAAGVPAVVGSLWDLDDAQGPAFQERFHRHYLARGSALAALAATRAELLADPDPALSHPSLWSPYVLIGGPELTGDSKGACV